MREESVKIRILVFLRYVGRQGGLQAVVNNYYKRFDQTKFEIEYLVLTHEEPEHENQLMESGTVIHCLDGIPQRNLALLFRSCRAFFARHHDYDILHCHQTNFDFIPLFWARHYGIPCRIIHSHNTSSGVNRPQFLCEKYLSRWFANQFMACSEDAGRFLFGKKIVMQDRFSIITNAIDIQKYKFDPETRKKQREALNIGKDEIVFCQIARFSPEKRQELTLRAFLLVHAQQKNTRLFFVGNGDGCDEVRRMSRRLSEDHAVEFLGVRKDIAELLQAFDVFVMPSLFEGVSVSLLEAQAAGLPCLLSDGLKSVLPDEGRIVRVQKDAAPEKWAEGMKRCSVFHRRDNGQAIKDAGYSIADQVLHLQKLYEEMCGIDND